MIAPHPRFLGALAVIGLLGVLGMMGMRLLPLKLRFDPLHPPRTGVPKWRVDLDTAPAEELQLLPGVGPRLARRIVQDRESRGAFGGVRGLDRVSGVGESVIERVAPHVR